MLRHAIRIQAIVPQRRGRCQRGVEALNEELEVLNAQAGILALDLLRRGRLAGLRRAAHDVGKSRDLVNGLNDAVAVLVQLLGNRCDGLNGPVEDRLLDAAGPSSKPRCGNTAVSLIALVRHAPA